MDYNLTARETEIVQLIGSGLSNKEIAGKLFISENTVAKHVRNIYEKVNVNKRTELLHKLAYDRELYNYKDKK